MVPQCRSADASANTSDVTASVSFAGAPTDVEATGVTRVAGDTPVPFEPAVCSPRAPKAAAHCSESGFFVYLCKKKFLNFFLDSLYCLHPYLFILEVVWSLNLHQSQEKIKMVSVCPNLLHFESDRHIRVHRRMVQSLRMYPIFINW